ncbi:MAG: hypothetical protein K2X76_15755 [Sphingomonas sp.]|nr:hypothetical protein [Sphingomonas sp.]
MAAPLENVMAQADQPLALGVQLAAAAAMLVVMITLHALGLMAISNWRALDEGRLKASRFGLRALPLLGGIAISLFALHLLEIGVFALFYWLVVHPRAFEQALYASASAYATLGAPEERVFRPWRLLIALEALTGFVFITWSTAFIVGVAEKLRS